jgi:hypothetical protein
MFGTFENWFDFQIVNLALDHLIKRNMFINILVLVSNDPTIGNQDFFSLDFKCCLKTSPLENCSLRQNPKICKILK